MSLVTRGTFALLVLGCGARNQLDASGGVGGGAFASSTSTSTSAGGGRPPCGPPANVYALDGAGVLYAYDPLAGVAKALGSPSCGDSLWTMTATEGTAYIAYNDGSIYAVDLATLACARTPFDPGQLGLETQFAVAAVGAGASERLYVYGLPATGGPPILAVADTTSFRLTKVGDVLPTPPTEAFTVNLTADGEGHLYAYAPGGFVQKIDQATGAVLDSAHTGVATMSTWATIAYGAELYLWAGQQVVHYDLSARRTLDVVDAGASAIGAGAFLTCAG